MKRAVIRYKVSEGTQWLREINDRTNEYQIKDIELVNGKTGIILTMNEELGKGKGWLIPVADHFSIFYVDILYTRDTDYILECGNEPDEFITISCALNGITDEESLSKSPRLAHTKYLNQGIKIFDASLLGKIIPKKGVEYKNLWLIINKDIAFQLTAKILSPEAIDTYFNIQANQFSFRLGMNSVLIEMLQNIIKISPGEYAYATRLIGSAYLLLGNILELINEWPFMERINQHDMDAIIRSRSYLMTHLKTGFPGMEKLAELAHMSISKYRMLFIKVFKINPHKFYFEKRMQLAREMLLNGDNNIKDVAYALGFNDLSHFSRDYKKKYGINPKESTKLFL